MRDPYGPLNPLKTEHVANLIREVDRRIASPLYNDEIDPIPEEKLSQVRDLKKKKKRA